VDWELAGPGDRLLDVGAVLGEYVGAWLHSLPMVDLLRPERVVDLARCPLDRVHRAVRAFWAAYCRVDRSSEPLRVTSAARFAGVRLLQAAVEDAQVSSALAPRHLQQSQLACNMIVEPAAAAQRLLGLAPARDPLAP
jgi:hypothetical protein